MNIRPLIKGQSRAKQLDVIDDNLATIAGRLASSKEQLLIQQFNLMSRAVLINDEQDRQAFVDLINRFSYLANLQLETRSAVSDVRNQIKSMIDQETTPGEEASR